MTVYLLGTLDTKGSEVAFVRGILQGLSVPTCVMDTGCLGEPTIHADISREDVFHAADQNLAEVRQLGDRGVAVSHAAIGATRLVLAAHSRGELDGLLALGGSAGTSIGTAAMRALPLGVPKLMVSTLASGQTRPYVGGKDILMMNAVVDIAGINRISRPILANAACALGGMVKQRCATSTEAQTTDRPMIAATMFGVTTPCVDRARRVLETAGFEVLVFHATGTGGEAMEGLIADGLFSGVLDITTTELADELVGGILTAGPSRLTAAGRHGVPQVISVGALDMVNFGPRKTVPDRFNNRQFYEHNPTVTLMRTTEQENQTLGREIGTKASAATGPTAILFPRKGISAIDQTGKPFEDVACRMALLKGIRETLTRGELIELDDHINDTEFAEAAARKLLSLIRCQVSSSK